MIYNFMVIFQCAMFVHMRLYKGLTVVSQVCGGICAELG